ncbi:Pkinase domain-containing protein/LRR_1 domain-containing protein [Cephalotus follicularis]|uniref:non-specific serine/threonine protein kinase n=1 Tax=Cephalotus follicularis TaxID=3775 RepID=A0A1Q3CB87_CEPFO|nr:Pkinase domain-containing protein/LRR_1 domain-containing protein [Cephalotus follicularis]
MGSRVLVFLLILYVHVFDTISQTDPNDFAVLKSLMDIWENLPPNWKGFDPCGSNWDGIGCTKSRVTSITLANVDLKGQLSSDIPSLTELGMLDLSYNKRLTGSIPRSFGDLKKLTNLILVGCGLTGPIPDTIGSLQRLIYLSLNSNSFSGPIPASIGNLSNLYWLDLADNKLDGTIPVSHGTTPGLDNLVNTKHFHFGQNELSGTIPPNLFSSNMTLIHVLFESNQLTGSLPSTLGLVQTLEAVRFDRNQLSGPVPSNINNLTNVNELFLSNNRLTGLVPNLTGMILLQYLDMSNNSFDASDAPSWFSTLQSLTTLMMDSTQLRGHVPVDLFSLSNLQTVVLRNNRLNGTLDIGTSYSNQLQLINLQNNLIDAFTERVGGYNADSMTIILVSNPVCEESGEAKSYCMLSKLNSSYSTPPNNCIPIQCSSDQISSPTCQCAYPYTGTLFFRAPSFSDLGNTTNYVALQNSMVDSFQSHQLPVDSVSLSNPRKNNYLELSLDIFPSGQNYFNRSGISQVANMLSNQTLKPPSWFGPYFFIGEQYNKFSEAATGSNNSSSIGIIIGATVGGCVLLLLLLLAGVYAFRQKKRAQRATEKNNPFAHWDPDKGSGSIPQLKGARNFSFEELKKCTQNFSEANEIGSGGYGKVYRGTLPSGQLIAIKRAQQESMQGALEFKTEIELLSRVHHKNVVSLVGFCYGRGEEMLIYEYVPNGSLKDCLSGKSGIRLDWTRRLKVTLGAARGLAYLHELADPPIIHRDIKSNNILLDERLNAKVSDFGLSKPMGDNEKGQVTHITTQVKGTMGYLDPEYYMTQQLTEKSDVYSFGVLMLELITARRPIERGKYIVREVRMAMDKTKDLYNLHEIVDPVIVLGVLKGFEKFMDIAMRCLEESGVDRPTMGEVVKEIENIMQIAGLNPNVESATTSASYEEVSKGSFLHPYNSEAFEYSGAIEPSKIEPQ